MDLNTVIVLLVAYAVGMVVLYYVIVAAVTEAMKRHTRWHVANRAALEKKYAGKPWPDGV